MKKYTVVGELVINRTFSVEVEARDDNEAEDFARLIIENRMFGEYVVHHSTDDTNIINVVVSEKGGNNE